MKKNTQAVEEARMTSGPQVPQRGTEQIGAFMTDPRDETPQEEGKRGWRRRGRTFHPRLTLEHTGYSGDSRRQWCLGFLSSSGRNAECGLQSMDDVPVEAAWQEARTFLLKIGAKPTEIDHE